MKDVCKLSPRGANVRKVFVDFALEANCDSSSVVKLFPCFMILLAYSKLQSELVAGLSCRCSYEASLLTVPYEIPFRKEVCSGVSLSIVSCTTCTVKPRVVWNGKHFAPESLLV
jgi:hypothetical protein